MINLRKIQYLFNKNSILKDKIKKNNQKTKNIKGPKNKPRGASLNGLGCRGQVFIRGR
jgi:hypothetical protein